METTFFSSFLLITIVCEFNSQSVVNSTLSYRKFLCINKPCGKNAECILTEDGGFCICKCGFSGDPYYGCEFSEPNSVFRIKLGNKLPIKLSFTPDIPTIYRELVKKSNYFYYEAFVEDRLRRWGAYKEGSISIMYLEYVNHVEIAFNKQLNNRSN